MNTIEQILENAKPSIAKTHEHVTYFWEDRWYFWEGRWALSTRYLELVHYISDDRWEGYLTVFEKTRELSSEEIEFVRNYLDL